MRLRRALERIAIVTAVLLANAAATLFLLGLSTFVHFVHYPLFTAVGEGRFRAYHAVHSDRTTWVVIGPMVIELASSLALIADPPAGETALVLSGAALAVAVWALTAAGAAPAHGRLGDGPDPRALRSLIRISGARTLAWAAHGAVVIALLGAALASG